MALVNAVSGVWARVAHLAVQQIRRVIDRHGEGEALTGLRRDRQRVDADHDPIDRPAVRRCCQD